MSRSALHLSRRMIALLTSAIIALLLVTAPTAQAAPGDNLAVDDPFSSARTQWWRDGRFGMFIHFGVYSAFKGVYGTCRDAEWIKRNCAVPWPEYEAKAATFDPAQFDAQAVVNAAKAAGQKYIVITSKHHDGFAMWPTKANDWNLADRSGFTRDILGELKTAADAAGIKFGLYYSIWDWHDPDAQPGSTTFPAYVARMKAQLQELKTRYNPALFWFDGEWEAPWNDRHGEDLEKYMRGLAPGAIINNRVGTRTVSDGDYGTPEQFIPNGPPVGQPWESCMTMNGTWGYAEWDNNYKSVTTLTRNLIGIAANSGVFLLNIGPTDTGAVPQPQLDRLAAMGDWLRVNGSAVHGASHTALVDKPSWGVVSRAGNTLYASVYSWPAAGQPLRLSTRATITGARVVGSTASVTVTPVAGGYDLTPNGSATNAVATVIALDIAPVRPAGAATGTGLKAEFFTNTGFTGTPAVTRLDPTVNYSWKYTGSPAPTIPADGFAGRWTGFIEPRFTETYTFSTLSDDTVELWVGGNRVIGNTTPHGPTVDSGTITLQAGTRYPIRLQHTENGGQALMKLFWSSPNTPQQIVPSSALYPTAPTIINDTATGITYTGTGWFHQGGRGFGDYQDDVHASRVTGDAAGHTFTGTGVDVFAEKYSDQGLVDVYLDGALKATVDTTSPVRLTQQVVYSARGLTPGQHTVRLVKRSGTYMLLDRIDVYTG